MTGAPRRRVSETEIRTGVSVGMGVETGWPDLLRRMDRDAISTASLAIGAVACFAAYNRLRRSARFCPCTDAGCLADRADGYIDSRLANSR